MADAFDRVDRLEDSRSQVYNIEIGGKYFNVTAPSEEEAYVKARAYLAQLGQEPQEAGAAPVPAGDVGPPSSMAGEPPPQAPVPADPNDPANLPSVTEGGAMLDAQGRPIQPPEEKPENPIVASTKRFGQMVWGQYLRTKASALGVPEVAATMGTGAVGEIVGGVAGAIVATGAALPGSPVDYNDAAATVEYLSDALTFAPKSRYADDLLRSAAGPLMALENGVDHVATWAATDREGNFHPGVATTVKTGLLGAPELLGLRGVNSVRRFGNATRKAVGRVTSEANKLGIDLTQKNMAASIIEEANRMSPNVRGQHADELHEALLKAHEADKTELNATFEAARNGKARLYVANIENVAPTIRQNVMDAYDINGQGMETVRNALDDLDSFRAVEPRSRKPRESTNILQADLREFETIRRRLSKVRKQDGTEAAGAAQKIIHDMDEFLMQQMNDGLIAGRAQDLKLWTTARKQNADYMKRWGEDRIIKNLLDSNATPEQMHAWLLGASAVSSQKAAGSVVRRLKNILGDDHPAIRGIRQDFLYEVVAPLLEVGDVVPKTALKQFVRNYDRTIRRNPTLVKELGLNERTDLKPLRDFADTASRLPDTSRLVSLNDISTYASRFLLGHEIAKATIRVNLGRNIVNLMVGADRVGRKQIIAEVAGAMFDQPVKQGPGVMNAYAQLSAAMALSSITDTQEQADEGGPMAVRDVANMIKATADRL